MYIYGIIVIDKLPLGQ